MKSGITTLLLLSCFTTLIAGCAVLHKKEPGYDKIVLGSGGGFTGMVNSFSITSEGAVKSERDNKTLTQLNVKHLKEIRKKLDASKVLETPFEKPGNFYYFIEVTKNGKTNRITWSDQDKAPQTVIDTYNYIMNLIKSEKND